MRKEIYRNESYNKLLLESKVDLLTFFTPTYNRARFLPRVYDCLKNQTCHNFVWIVVNDGSIDNTSEIIHSFLEKEEISILYIDKENGGKHSAFEAALTECDTTYFLCMDDDDIYFSNAVDFFLKKWKEIKSSPDFEKVGAIRTLSLRPDGSYSANFDLNKLIGTEENLTTLESNYVLGRQQENWTCYDTKKLLSIDLFSHDYWLSEHHKFFVESIWQGRFARKYMCRYVYKAFTEYRADDDVSLIRAKKSRQYYLDMFINDIIILNEQYDYISLSFKRVLTFVVRDNLLRDYLGIGIRDLVCHLNFGILKILFIITYPISLIGKMTILYKNS